MHAYTDVWEQNGLETLVQCHANATAGEHTEAITSTSLPRNDTYHRTRFCVCSCRPFRSTHGRCLTAACGLEDLQAIAQSPNPRMSCLSKIRESRDD